MKINSQLESEIKNAIIKNKIDYLKKLPENFVFEDGTGLIHWAAMYNNEVCLLNELKIKGKENAKGGYLKSTPLYYALYNSNYLMMLYLLESGADTNYINTTGNGLLHACAKMDDVLGLILLLTYGANIEIKNKEEIGVEKFAIECNSESVMNYFNKNKKDNTLIIEVVFIITHIILYASHQKLYLISYFILFCFWLVVVFTKIPVYLNIFYTTLLIYKTLRLNKETVLSVMHMIECIYKIFLMKPKFLKKKSIRDVKEIIRKLIKAGKYTTKDFCYSCLNFKSIKTHHCAVCNMCVLDFDHHCPCLNKCIDSKMNLVFMDYLLSYLEIIAKFYYNNEDKKHNIELIGGVIFIFVVILNQMRRFFNAER